MRESAMVGKAESRAAEKTSDHVEVRSLRRERERERGQRGLAVESGAAQACSGQKVGDGFQAFEEFYRKAISRAREPHRSAWRSQQRQRIRHHGDLDRERSQQLAVRLNVNLWLRLGCRGRQILAR